jgi:ribulose 1,5-bisphosphate synthetase/thiazole synthase
MMPSSVARGGHLTDPAPAGSRGGRTFNYTTPPDTIPKNAEERKMGVYVNWASSVNFRTLATIPLPSPSNIIATAALSVVSAPGGHDCEAVILYYEKNGQVVTSFPNLGSVAMDKDVTSVTFELSAHTEIVANVEAVGVFTIFTL